MEAFRDIEFTEIAADWDSAPLGREHEPLLLLMRNGLTTGQSKDGGELQVTRIETISDGIIDEQKVRWVSGLKPDQIEKYRIQKGDILFSHINSDPHLGKSAIALKDYSDLLHGMNLLLLRANRGVLEPEFLHFVFCYYRTKGVFIKICSRSVNQSSINQAKLKALEIPLPPLPEQQKIAAVLGLVQRAIEEQERLIALTTELKKALLHKLFTEGLRGEPQKQTEIGPVPESWEVVHLEDAFKTQLGKMLSQKAHVGNDPKYYLRNKNVQWGRIDLSDMLQMDFSEREKEKFLLARGDLLVCEGGEPGRAAIWKGEIQECYYQKALHRLRPKDDRITNDFLGYWMAFSFQLQNLYGVAGASSTIAHLPEVQLKTLPIPRPERAEQDEICNALSHLDGKISLLERKRTTVTELFRTLLHQLMTAQIRVNDLDLDGILVDDNLWRLTDVV
jgi:type I restriction enzyme S subunit